MQTVELQLCRALFSKQLPVCFQRCKANQFHQKRKPARSLLFYYTFSKNMNKRKSNLTYSKQNQNEQYISQKLEYSLYVTRKGIPFMQQSRKPFSMLLFMSIFLYSLCHTHITLFLWIYYIVLYYSQLFSCTPLYPYSTICVPTHSSVGLKLPEESAYMLYSTLYTEQQTTRSTDRHYRVE